MHFAIRYLTEYRYREPVTDNLNALRVKPATTPCQRVDDFAVRVEPETRLTQHLDYYGTTVIEFGISKPHEQLAIDVRARVVTTPAAPPPEADWEPAVTAEYAAHGGEYLLAFGAEPDDIAIDELVGLSRAATPAATLQAVTELIPDRFEYRPGVTYVGSTVEDLLTAGAGVCQDFAHLALVLLRRHGVAARYVSGYLFAPPAGDEGADSAEVDTHAWIEALIPAAEGEPVWVAADPTNRGLAGERHVKIGHGRHYSDVPPIKGVYRGGATAELEASVRMTRTDTASRTAPAAG
ncbi:MAG: transglutaminase family protein [Solirubrobacterales bacterium]|jgi:transglutaminase-like putative cysteine protease|nr:transglutaminase family protein [Solirubrobacterales bacterium]